MMGEHDFGPATVTFSSDQIEWCPADRYSLPDGTYPLVSVPMHSISGFQVDKKFGGLALWTMHESPLSAQLGGKWAPLLSAVDRTDPASSIFIEYDPPPYQNPDGPSWPSEIVKLSDRVKRHAQFVGPGAISGRGVSQSE